MDIDVKEKHSLVFENKEGIKITGKDLHDFLSENMLNTDLGSFNYTANYFVENGVMPEGRPPEEIAEIRSRISNVMMEVKKVQDFYVLEVIEPIEREIENRSSLYKK